MSQKPEHVTPFRALWVALLNRSIDYFPRVKDGENWKSLPSGEIVSDAVSELKNVQELSEDDPKIDRMLSLARQSLNEVKTLTEYQDSKATRLLTVLTFLSALAGAVFGRFLEAFPAQELLRRLAEICCNDALQLRATDIFVVFTYFFFSGFVFSALCGGLITFHAIRTRFKYPQSEKTGEPNSFLFYEGILNVDPASWAKAFTKETSPGKRDLVDLHLEYIQNYIVEAYLVAAKAADKLRYLSAGQSFQAWAMRFLLGFFVFAALASSFGVPRSTPDPISDLGEQVKILNESIANLSSRVPQSIKIEAQKDEASGNLQMAIEALSRSLETLVGALSNDESAAGVDPAEQQAPKVE